MLRLVFFISSILCFCVAYIAIDREPQQDYQIEYVDKVTITDSLLFKGALVGGLSSIDYLGKDRFVVISDDRSEFSPARIFEMNISFDTKGFRQYSFSRMIQLKNKVGENFKQDGIDPESIRFRPSSNTYIYASEGGRVKDRIDPFVWEITREGEFLYDFSVPDVFQIDSNTGVRENGGFESLTFENDTIIWYANELPLLQDGELAGFEEGDHPIRLVRHDIKNDLVLNQFVYGISKVHERPINPDGFYINSVAEILFIKTDIIWVMERSYVEGVGNKVKVFEVNLRDASSISNVSSLRGYQYSVTSKKLLLDFSNYGQKIDNIEGMAFGPDFADGSKSIVFISDNNFNKQQETQLWLFSMQVEK